MSFPYVLDLSFGSEKPTADPLGRISFGGGNEPQPPLPTEGDLYDHYIDLEGYSKNILVQEGDRYYWATEEYTPSNIYGFLICVTGSTNRFPKQWVKATFEEGSPNKFWFSASDIGLIGEYDSLVCYTKEYVY